MKIEFTETTRSTSEEEVLSHLEYIMSCASQGILGECKYELMKLIQSIQDSYSLHEDIKSQLVDSLHIIRHLLESDSRNLREVNILFWKLHPSLKRATHEAIKKASYQNVKISFN